MLDVDVAFLPHEPTPALVFLPALVAFVPVEASTAASPERLLLATSLPNRLELVVLTHCDLPCWDQITQPAQNVDGVGAPGGQAVGRKAVLT